MIYWCYNTSISLHTELSEAEKLEVFKKKIWKEIDSWPRCSSISESIQITDSAFKRMMNDDDFKNKMMKLMKEDADVGRPPIVAGITWIDENGYRGISYNDSSIGVAAFEAHSKSKNSFYVKKEKGMIWKMRGRRLDKIKYINRKKEIRSILKKNI